MGRDGSPGCAGWPAPMVVIERFAAIGFTPSAVVVKVMSNLPASAKVYVVLKMPGAVTVADDACVSRAACISGRR